MYHRELAFSICLCVDDIDYTDCFVIDFIDCKQFMPVTYG